METRGIIKVNLMCGRRNFGKDWIHIDGQNYPHTDSSDIYLQGYKDIDLIYCSHGIAYFDREEIIPLLKTWHKKLKKGGILRLSTPDWDVLRTFSEPMLGPLYGKMNEPPIYHKTVYTENELSNRLRVCGFNFVKRYDHKTTEHQHFDDHAAAYYNGILISLNLEANA